MTMTIFDAIQVLKQSMEYVHFLALSPFQQYELALKIQQNHLLQTQIDIMLDSVALSSNMLKEARDI